MLLLDANSKNIKLLRMSSVNAATPYRAKRYTSDGSNKNGNHVSVFIKYELAM
jgi:hypothetical protein